MLFILGTNSQIVNTLIIFPVLGAIKQYDQRHETSSQKQVTQAKYW